MSSISNRLYNIDPTEEAVTDNTKLTSTHTHTQCHTQVLWVHTIYCDILKLVCSVLM